MKSRNRSWVRRRNGSRHTGTHLFREASLGTIDQGVAAGKAVGLVRVGGGVRNGQGNDHIDIPWVGEGDCCSTTVTKYQSRWSIARGVGTVNNTHSAPGGRVGREPLGGRPCSGQGRSRLIGSTGKGADFVEVTQHTAGEGPYGESFRTGRRVTISVIEAVHDTGPVFREATMAQGFRLMRTGWNVEWSPRTSSNSAS